MQAPQRIVNRKGSRELRVEWPDGREDHLSWEFLRVHSPSAEVQGHGNPKVIPGKREVGLERIEPVGRYAVKLVFDDGHDTGLYSWEILDHYGRERDTLWQQYLDALQEMGMTRESDVVSLKSLHYPAKG
ncbi:gamma-butyrobetaine hydroxylase-like domain-containing protein [Algiphilus sp.]|uniref:gamma-butyrobetaine hydroxylase-like domain-containing protein n=1 Tax=Algiphilus sp. TaxID=1872431 RepID=UPI003C52C2CD